MKVSTKGRYALRLMIDIAGNSRGQFLSLKDISQHQMISVKYLEQITSQLCKAGLIRSSRGPMGGYRLAREPGQYTVGEILRATEGKLQPTVCLEDEINQCPRVVECPTIRFWQGLSKTINDYVDSVTLQDLLKRGASSGTEPEDKDGTGAQNTCIFP